MKVVLLLLLLLRGMAWAAIVDERYACIVTGSRGMPSVRGLRCMSEKDGKALWMDSVL